MRFLVFSDIHNGSVLPLKKYLDSCDGVIFLGDGEERLGFIENKPLFAVRGNCDPSSLLPEERELVFGDKRLLICHGHRYYVKHGRQILAEEGAKRGCAALLFGHTHIPCCVYEGGLLLCNPGSAGGINPTCGILGIEKSGIMFTVIDLKSGEILL